MASDLPLRHRSRLRDRRLFREDEPHRFLFSPSENIEHIEHIGVVIGPDPILPGALA